MMARKFAPLIMLQAVILIASLWAWPALAGERPGGETVLTCRIEGQNRVASIALAGGRAIYSYGRPQTPELVLSIPLVDLDYRREDGAGDTIDEIATFANGDTTYRFSAGFRNGALPVLWA